MKKMKRFFAFVLCLAMVLPLLNTPALAMTSDTTDVVTEDVYDTDVDYDAEYVEGRILIKYSDDTDKALLEERMLENDFWISSDVQMEDGTVAVVCLPDDMDVRTAIETVTYFPGVLYAQPDYIYEEAAYELQDEYLAEQYYLDMVKATEAWEYMDTVECSDVLVAIIDSGIYFNHEDIDFIDYEKSVLVDGGADIEIRPIESEESNNHGTHVAGIIGATANDIGIAGVASGSEHIKAIMIDADIYGDFYTSVLIKAVDYASESGARVINMSLGGTKGTSATDILYQDAVENAYKKGALVVAAAGNSHSNKVVFPSDAEHAVSVIATNEDGLKASYSNYGGADSAINKVCAPGTDIMSTTADGMYANMSGSSMAAPIVSAIAAMMISVNPSLTCEDVRQIIFGTATDLYDEGYDYYSGYGMVNAYECVKKAAETTTTGVDSINIVAPETTVTKGGTLQLSHSGDADTVGYWGSSDTRTATVDQTGLVTSINDGIADITYYTSNGLKDSVTITCVGSANAQKLETPVIANNNTGYSFIYWMPIENADYYEIYCSTERDGEYQYLTTTTDRKYSRRESTEVGQLYYGYSDDVYYKVRACSNSADYLCSDFSEVNKSMWAPTTYSRIFFEDISATSTLVTWYGRGYCSLYTSDSRDGEYKLVATYDQGREALEYLDTDITVGQRKYYQVRYFNECTVESSQSYLDKEGYDNHVNSYGVLNSDDTLPAPNLKKVKTSELTDDPTQPYIRIYGNVGSENANTYYNVYVEESVDGGITWKPAYSKSVINVVCSDSYGNYDFGHKLEFGEDVLIRYALMRKVRDYPDDSENYDTSLYIGEFSDIISVSTSTKAEPRIIGVTKDDEFYNVTWDANVDDSDVKKVIYEYRVLNADNTYSTGTVSVTVNGTLEKTKSFSIADIGENASFRIRLYINNTGLSCENTDVTVTVSSRYSIYSKYVSVASSKEHVIKHIVAKKPTFFRAGNIDCYYCRHCDKYYSDAKGLEEISKESAIIDCNKDISDCEVSVDKHSLTYNGYSVIPCIKLYSGGKQVGSENYTLEYENNNSVGDATITLTGNPAFGVTGKKVLVLPIDLQDIVLNNIQIDDNHVVSLSWNSVPGAEYYDIYSRPAGRDIWTRTGSTKVNTFSEEVRVHDTIEYCVMAVAGEISKVSNTKSIEIPLTIPKTAITSLTNISNGITIKWNESEGATAYEIYRKEDGGTYSKIATVSALTYTDSDTKTNGTKYTYYVKAIAIEGEKTYEAENSDEKEIYFVTAPAISSVTSSATGTVVKWNKIDGATGYVIYRKAGDGAFAWRATINNGETVSYTDTNSKANGTKYTYYIQAVKTVDGVSYRSVASASKMTYFVTAPTISSVTPSLSGTVVKWNKIYGASSYVIYKKAGDGNFAWCATINNGSTVSYTDTKAKANGTKYTYYVQAVRIFNGVSYRSGASTSKMTYYVTAPTISSVTPATTGTVVKWNKIYGASGYVIYKKTGTGSFAWCATINNGSTVSYTDTKAKTNGTKYTYYVQAIRTFGGVQYRSAASTSKMTYYLATPTIRTLTNSAAGKMTVGWYKNSQTTGYQIKYVYTGGTEKTVTISGNATISKIITGMVKGKTYKVYVRALKKVGTVTYYSAWSTVKTLKITK